MLWILGKVFTDECLRKQLCFKGGTSLSKVYGVIERFSEDIDLILAQHLILNDGECLVQESKRKQAMFNALVDERAGQYISGRLLKSLRASLAYVQCVQTQ